MFGSDISSTQHRTQSEAKSSAALSSLLAALGISLLKLITGIATGSLGMLSEAAHSGIDLIASGLTLLSVRASDRPADDDHNYGHGKIESISAGFETVLMISSCLFIGYKAIERIVHHRHLDLAWSLWPFLVLLLSMSVDFTRSRNLSRVAREQHSDALEADALHFGTDIWSSAAVIVGLLATYLGERLHIPQLEYADPIAALIVACIILVVTWRLARRTFDVLTDATPPEVRQKLLHDISADLEAIDGVLTVDRMRIRRAGPKYFVDLTLGMPRTLTFQRSEQVTFAANAAVQRLLPEADVVIHTVPTASVQESVFDRVRAVASRANLAIHDVTVQQFDDGLRLEQHLEVDENLPLRQAHELVTRLEADQHREVPELASILTHIESEPATISRPGSIEEQDQLIADLREAARPFPEIEDVHEISVSRAHDGDGTGLQINCHCTLPDNLPMQRVHVVITELESTFRATHPRVRRVLIHPEPATDNQR